MMEKAGNPVILQTRILGRLLVLARSLVAEIGLMYGDLKPGEEQKREG